MPGPTYMRPPSLSMSRFIAALEIKDGVLAEIGSYAGESTEQFELSGKFRLIYAVDPWENWQSRDHMGDNMARIERIFDRRMADYPVVKKCRGRSPFAASDFADGSLDMVYIDAFHDRVSVLADIRAWAPKVKDGGIISGHDFGVTAFPGVQETVMEAFGHADGVFPDYSWFVRKRNPGGSRE